MSHRHLLEASFLALVLVACGGGSQGGAPTATAGGERHDARHEGHEGHEGHGEHGALPAELAALHDVLAPVWHAEPGPTRASTACAQAEALAARSHDVDVMVTPAAVDGLPWSQATAHLVATSTALIDECHASGPAVEARLSDLHDAFHALVEQLAHAHAEPGASSADLVTH